MIRENITQMSAYTPPLNKRTSEYLLLDFNERTIPVSPYIQQQLIAYLQKNRLQTYPSYDGFLQKLSNYVGVVPEQLMITNGSDQGIDILFRATCEKGAEVIIPTPSFAIFNQSARIENLDIKTPFYTREKGFPTDDILQNISDKTQLIVICNPNNPTGTLTPQKDIIKILDASKNAAVFIDECYFEYTQETMKDYITTYKNLFITRTFSKAWGLPSLRLGYIMSDAKNIQELLKIRGPYDVNQLAVVAVSAALEQPAYMQEYVEEILKISKPIVCNFLTKKNISYWPTAANFVLIEFSDTQKIQEQLQKQDILVRPQKGVHIENTIRINLGTKTETEKLINVLEGIL